MPPVLNINEALSKGDFNLVRKLVESGAEVNLQDKEGRTALINCCLHDGETWASGAARLLLTHGAKLSLCDKVGRNALMYAILYKRESLVKLFLNALDCDLTHTDKWRHTVLWYAVLSGNAKIAAMLKETLKKYGLDTEKILGTKENSATHQAQKPHQHSKAKASKIQCKAPYKTIPAVIWEKRAKFCTATKSNILQTALKLDSNSMTQEKSSSPNSESLTSGSNSDQGNSEDPTWRQDFQKLTATLEMQLSSSYCRKARILPPSIRRYPKICKSEMDRYSEVELCGKRSNKNRRLSVDVLDVLQRKKSTKGILRRRCSVAVIPLIRFQSYKSPFSNQQEQQKSKSLMS